MTDRERAGTIVLMWCNDNVMVPQARDMALALEAQFATVRADERARVVAWLRGIARNRQDAELLDAAEAIERGEHERAP